MPGALGITVTVPSAAPLQLVPVLEAVPVAPGPLIMVKIIGLLVQLVAFVKVAV